MHEAEQQLNDKQRRDFAFRLLLSLCDGSAVELSEHFDLLHANARQKAEAFLKAMGKWESGKNNMKDKQITIFEKRYSEEMFCDLERDILEAISEDYNPIMKKVPSNEGIFKVIITWTPE
jgi:hypothetical protein